MGRGLVIPSYGLPEEDPHPLNPLNLPADVPAAAFGGGEAAQEANQQTAGLAGSIAKRADETYRDEYKNAVQLQGLELANQLTAEETRSKNALSQIKGKDAMEARGKALQSYDEYYQNLTKGISNPDVKMLAKEHYSMRRNTLDAWATPYANQQMEEYDNSELLAGIKNEADSAAADPTPANVAVSVMSQKLAIAEFGERNGRGPDWIKSKQMEASSSTHLEALKAIVNAHQDITAREFFDRNKGEFVGNDVARAEELIKAGSSLSEAMRVRDAIFSVQHEEVKGKDGEVSIKTTQPPITEAEVRDRLNELTKGMDPETRLQAERLSFTQWAQEKQIQEADQAQRFEEAAKILDTTNDPTQIPRDMYLGLSAKQREWIDERAMRRSKPPRIEDDPIAYNKWKSLSDDAKANMSDEEFKLMWDTGKFTVKTMEKISDEVEALNRKDDRIAFKWKHDDTKKAFEAIQQVGLYGLTGSDRLGTLKGEKNLQVMNFLKHAESAMTSEAAGKPMSQRQKDEVIDQMIKDQGLAETMKPSWWEYISPYGPRQEFIGAYSPSWGTAKGIEIPDANKARILKSYPGASESKIQMLYQAEKNGMGPYGLKMLADQIK